MGLRLGVLGCGFGSRALQLGVRTPLMSTKPLPETVTWLELGLEQGLGQGSGYG